MFCVPRYDPVTFPDLHGGPAGICAAHGTGRAHFACPFVLRSHIMQVFLADFAGPPRWQFTSSSFIIGKFSRWTRCACCSTTIIDVSVGHKTFRTLSGSCTVLPHIARLTRGTTSSCKSTCFTIQTGFRWVINASVFAFNAINTGRSGFTGGTFGATGTAKRGKLPNTTITAKQCCGCTIELICGTIFALR